MTPVLDSDPLAALEDEHPEMSSRTRRLCVGVKERFDMPWDDAVDLAKQLGELFNGRREIDDEELSKDLRSMFYALQAKELLTTRREEFKSPEGKTLRAFYWTIDEETLESIHEEMTQSHVERATEDDDSEVYEALPEEAWARQAN